MLDAPSEQQEQIAFFSIVRNMSEFARISHLIHAIPNGGKRHIATAKNLKKEGVLKGIPDIFLPVAMGGFHGLYIEMKRVKGGSLTVEQKGMINRLTEQGYKVDVCKGLDAAIAVLREYLALHETTLSATYSFGLDDE